MKTTVHQEAFKAGLQAVGRAASPRPALPVLANVLLEAGKQVSSGSGQLKLAATNLQLGITCWIPAEVKTPGATTLPAATLSDLVGNLPAGNLALSLNGKTEALTIQADQSQAKVKGIAASEFPPHVTGEQTGKQVSLTVGIAADLLKELIRRTVFSAGLDDSRPILTGVLFDLQDDRLTLSSADGFRLSTAWETLAEPVNAPRQALVPASSLKEFLAVAPDRGSLEMRLAPERVTFNLQDLEGPLQALEVVSLLLDGKFPDFAGVVPKDYATTVIVDRPALLRACRQALIFARESSNLGIFKITPGEDDGPGQIVISGHSSETGSNSSTVAAEVEGDGLEIGFNLRYLQEALQIIRAPSVQLGLTTPESPGALRAVGDEAFTHVLMPMHL